MGDESGHHLLQLDDMLHRSTLPNCVVVWHWHLNMVRDQIAGDLLLSSENMHFYELSLLRNASQVENQLLHHDCPFPPVLQEVEDSGDQDGLEEDVNKRGAESALI